VSVGSIGVGPGRSPWLSIWFNPGDTIERVLVAKPTLFRLLLPAAGGNAALIVSVLIGEDVTTALLDWRVLAGLAVIAAVSALVNLYLSAFLLGLSGWMFRGHASPAAMRAVVAWSMAPFCAALVISLALIAALGLIGGGDIAGPAAAAVASARRITDMAAAAWAFIAVLRMLRRVQAFGWWRTTFSFAAGTALSLFLVVLPVGAFLFEPFTVPGRSMMPALLDGDEVFVSKYAYGYSSSSLPFSLLEFEGRIFPAEPRRGDIAVFRGPKDPSVDYVKRIIGLPGDRIQMKDGVLIINDVPVPQENVDDFVDEETGERIRRWRETLPGGVSYVALNLTDSGFLDNTQVYAVPPGHYFMLGDNRDNSTDSRVLSAIGYVPFENLIGRAGFICFSLRRDDGRPPEIRLGRIGRMIR